MGKSSKLRRRGRERIRRIEIQRHRVEEKIAISYPTGSSRFYDTSLNTLERSRYARLPTRSDNNLIPPSLSFPCSLTSISITNNRTGSIFSSSISSRILRPHSCHPCTLHHLLPPTSVHSRCPHPKGNPPDSDSFLSSISSISSGKNQNYRQELLHLDLSSHIRPLLVASEKTSWLSWIWISSTRQRLLERLFVSSYNSRRRTTIR